jgi:ABC-type phosphonate transport system ATPase subunit
VASLAKATRKPGTSRDRIFNSSIGKRVFAYSVDPGDITKIVREDASGKKTLGRLVNGRFRTFSAKTP